MRKLAVISTTIFLVALISATGCQSNSTEQLKEAKQEVVNADENLAEAEADYLVDMENYKVVTAEKISANEKSIAEFKARVAQSKKDAKKDYEKKIGELEQKNTDMKRKLDEYKLEGKEMWDSFKIEFNHDMDELSEALKDLTVDNAM